MEPGSWERKFRVPRISHPHLRFPNRQPEPGLAACPRAGGLTPTSLTPYTLPLLPPSSPYDHPETPSHPPAGTPTPEQPRLPMKAGAFPLTQLSSPGSQRLGSLQCVKLM